MKITGGSFRPVGGAWMAKGVRLALDETGKRAADFLGSCLTGYFIQQP